MKTSLTVMTSLLATCLLLTACDDDFFSPTITIDTPTSAPTFTTTETEVMLGGTVELALDVSAMNVRADTRYVAEVELIGELFIWEVRITDLRIGDNPITVTAHGIYGDNRHANINVIRTE